MEEGVMPELSDRVCVGCLPCLECRSREPGARNQRSDFWFRDHEIRRSLTHAHERARSAFSLSFSLTYARTDESAAKKHPRLPTLEPWFFLAVLALTAPSSANRIGEILI